MKKRQFFWGIFSILLIFMLFLTMCDDPQKPEDSNEDIYKGKEDQVCTITFNSNGGSSVDRQEVYYGSTATRPQNPTRNGYTFDNWYSNSGLTTVYNFSTPVTSNITLYAKWNSNSGQTHIVTFISNGGSSVPNQTVNSGSTATRPQNPTRNGYTFVNWYSNSDLTIVYNFSTPVTSSISLYAKWNPDGDNGSDVELFRVIQPSDFIYSDGPFKGKLTNAVTYEILNLDGFLRIYISGTISGGFQAGWGVGRIGGEYNGYSLNVPNNAPSSGSYSFYVDVPIYEIPLYSDEWDTGVIYFNIWEGSFTNIEIWKYKDTSYTYTVTFNANGGYGTPPSSQMTESGYGITLPGGEGLSKAGYTFGGWNINPTGTGDTYTANFYYYVYESITLYAIWNPISSTTYTVTFNINGATHGTSPGPQMGEYGHSFTLLEGIDLSKPGYTFGGWNTEADGTGNNYSREETYTITGNITLYAKWNPITYTVTYNLNGGSGTTPPEQTAGYGSSIYLAGRGDITKPGYTLGGWNTEADGTGNTASTGVYYEVYDNITFYAKWNPAIYTITFDIYGGSGTAPSEQTGEANSSITLPNGNGFSRDGYVFKGWTTVMTGTGTDYNADSAYTITGNATLYAKWNQLYTITFNVNSGSGTVASEQEVAGTVITLPNGSSISKSGYAFGGWNTNATGTGTNYNASAEYTITGNITLYAKWNLTSIIVSFVSDAAPPLIKPIIHRSYLNGPTTATFTVENPAQYESISWKILNTTVSGNANTFILSTTNPQYNTAGEYVLTVEVRQNGVPFSRTINFTVAE
jgi:uncharacterized repeat protein (TIGR02543 family)